jgi:VWFA-related protein
VIGLSLGIVAASERRAATEAASQFRADSRLVLVPVSVTDAQDRPVMGLSGGDFRVYESGVEQRVAHFSREDAPLAMGFVFDTSMSMESKLAGARAAAAALLGTANPEDEFFLIEFQDEARVTQPLTEDARDIQTRLARARAKGRTALLDAVYLGVEELRKSSKPRKALVILSDGGDNRSRHTESAVRAQLRETDIAVYAMGIFDALPGYVAEEERNGPALLEEITRRTGGRLYPVDDLRDLPAAAARIGEELHNRYLIAYTPTNAEPGAYHKVQVKVVAPHWAHKLRVSWRPGYYEPKF